MRNFSRWSASYLVVFSVICAGRAAATPCASVSRANVARCAVAASLERQAGDASVRAAAGRIQANESWLASNPSLDLSAARREGPTATTLNWSASLGVELEVAGQRGARRSAARAERDAQKSLVGAVERRAASEALRLYFEVLAARDEQRVLVQVEAAATHVWQTAKAAAERGSAAGIEADVADAARVSTRQHRLEATRNEQAATASLASVLGLSATAKLDITGTLEPLEGAGSARRAVAPPDSPEATALSAEKRAAMARASAFRRARVPNPTISVFAQRDGFDENVLGVGLSFRLPMPQPVGHTNAGEIAENEALAERAGLLAEQERRGSRATLVRALAAYDAAQEVARAFSAERVKLAEETLTNLAAEVQAGRVPIRDAIVFQGPLLDLQLGAIESQKALCLASLEVVRAAGLPLAGDKP